MPWGKDSTVAKASTGGWGRDPSSTPKAKARADAERRAKTAPGQVRAFTQGVTFGFSDEIEAAGAALETGANNALARIGVGKGAGYGMRDAYDAVKQAESEQINAFARDHPAQNIGFNVLGAVTAPGAKAAAGFIAKGKNLVTVSGRSALVGAGAGGVAGFGSAEDGQRVEGAKRGATVGAVTGGALPSAARAAQSAGRAINAATGYRLTGGVNGAAAARLREALRNDGVDEATIRQAVKEWTATGAMPPSLADVAGENTRALLRFAGSRPGAARNAAQEYRDTTVESVPDASIDRARGLTANQQTADELRETLTVARGRVADEMYPQFSKDRVPVGDDLVSALSGRSGANALAAARRIADARRDYGALEEINAIAGGKAQDISAGTLDLIRRGLRDSASRAAREGDNTLASGLHTRESDLETALMDVPGFDSARRVYRHMSGEIEAVEVGARMLKDPPDTFAATLADMSGDALDAARVGARQAITDALGQRANAAGALKQIGFAPNARRNLEALFGPEEAQRFIQAARRNLEKAENANFVAPNTNSQTFSRGQDANIFGSAWNAVRRPLQTILEKLSKGLTLTDTEAEVLVKLGLDNPAAAIARAGAPKPNALSYGGRGAVVAPNALAQLP